MATPVVLNSVADFSNPDPRANINWQRQGFLLPNLDGLEISQQDEVDRVATTAAFNFTDTSLGGHFALNMPPQYTEYSDVTMGGDQTYLNAPGRTQMTVTRGFGMGRKYHEMINVNSQLVTMRFGVAAFNSLTSFLASFYDPRASQLARTGRVDGVFFTVGKALGSLFAVPFYPLVFGSTVIRSALGIPATTFQYFKPTMFPYWSAVNTIVNGLTANLGIHTRQLSVAQRAAYVDPLDNGNGIASDLENQIKSINQDLSTFLPDVYTSGGGIDVYAVANRAQRLADSYTKMMVDALQAAGSPEALRASLKNNLMYSNMVRPKDQFLGPKLGDYLAGVGGTTTGHDGVIESATDVGLEDDGTGLRDALINGTAPPDPPSTPDKPNDNTAPLPPASSVQQPKEGGGRETLNRFGLWMTQYAQSLIGNLHDGSDWLTMRVDYGGPIGESFSTSMRDSDLQQKINSQSSSARFASFDMANGNLVGGALGATIGAVVNSAADLIKGGLAGIQLSGLAALAGAALVDIPRMPDSSSVNMPSQSFSVELRAWCGHPLALLQQIYIPLACLLAGAVPRSTGPQAYTTPFYCQLFSQGRMQVRNGMITEMTITRGTSNVGFTEDNRPLGIDITFTVTDFSSVMHMPIMAATGFFDKVAMGAGEAIGGALGGDKGAELGGNIGAAISQGTYSDDSLFSDYLAILAGVDWKDQLYTFRRWSLARDRSRLDFDSFRSPSRLAAYTAGSWPGRLISIFVRGTDRP